MPHAKAFADDQRVVGEFQADALAFAPKKPSVGVTPEPERTIPFALIEGECGVHLEELQHANFGGFVDVRGVSSTVGDDAQIAWSGHGFCRARRPRAIPPWRFWCPPAPAPAVRSPGLRNPRSATRRSVQVRVWFRAGPSETRARTRQSPASDPCCKPIRGLSQAYPHTV